MSNVYIVDKSTLFKGKFGSIFKIKILVTFYDLEILYLEICPV